MIVDHINIGIHADGLADEERFLVDMLGFHRVRSGPEVTARFKPIWFEDDGGKQVHLSLIPQYAAGQGAHIALLFDNAVTEVVERLRAEGCEIAAPLEVDGSLLFFVTDPSGNRWELRDTRGAL